ncbi:MAG: hypothetical protein GX661_05730, partial [Acholeplasmataceae bacterium]|nr:hypothetical protein [Acholeplasmataceae bacterium]
MLKLFLLLGSLFLSNRIDYQEIIQQDESGLEILEEVGNYRLYKQQGKIYLSACHQSWIVEAGSCEAYYVLLKGSSLIYLYQHQGYWFIKEYDLNGNLKAEKQILDNQFELSAALYQDYLYLAGSINKYQNPGLQDLRDQKKLQGRDGILLCLDENYDLVDFKVYGGGLDEAFLAMTASEQYLYLAGSKDPLTGGDFGNGGRIDDCLFICKVDFDLNLIEYYVLSVPGSILEFCFYEDYLYLATNHNLYKFSSALETVQKKTYSDTYKFGCLAAFNRLLLFSETTINCINIFNFTATEFASPFLEEATIKAFERCLYLIKPDGRYYYDLACLENFIVLEYYYPEIETEKKVMTLFG